MNQLVQCLLIAITTLCVGESFATQKPVMTIGLIDTFSPDFYLETYVPTIEYLTNTLPQYQLEIKELNYRDLKAEISRIKPDFLIGSSLDFISSTDSVGAQQIVTKKRLYYSDVSHTLASTIIVNANRDDIRTLKDLNGKSIAASEEHDFDGWIISQGEIAKTGENPEKFFSKILWTHYNYPDAYTYLMVGQTDAAVLSTCEYEYLIKTGQLNPKNVKIINQKNDPAEQCVRSTDQYPDAVFMTLPYVSPKVTKAVTLALLSMPADKQAFEWVQSNSFLDVFNLLKSLKIGPYERLREITLKDFIAEHRQDIFFLLLLVGAIVVHIIRVNMLVERRTKELRQAVDRQHQLQKESQDSRKQLDLLEKTHALSQMCSIFAHEVKQPITNLIYYTTGLKLLLAQSNNNNQQIQQVLDNISQQARRTSDIVDRVRQYAKKKKRSSVIFDLATCIDHALLALNDDEKTTVRISTRYSKNSMVCADPFEMELIILNLLKNALAAAKKSEDPSVDLIVEDASDKGYCIRIQDNGPQISQAQFENLGSIVQSEKPDGLGIGLSIVCSLLESIGSRLQFMQRNPDGIEAFFYLQKLPSSNIKGL